MSGTEHGIPEYDPVAFDFCAVCQELPGYYRCPGRRPAGGAEPARIEDRTQVAERLIREHQLGEPPSKRASGAALLDEVWAFLARFVVFPSEAALRAVTLWAAHTHLIGSLENTPRLALLSPEPGSGKTRALEVLELLCPRPMHVLNASPAAIFRTIEKAPPTLLLDEVDTIFTRKGKDDEHQDLRGLLNSGYRAGATIPRCSGPQHEVRQFPTFCAVALAGLGDLPDTIMTRSVVIRMRRRAPGEPVEPFRRRLHRPEGERLQTALAQWADAVAEQISAAYPILPDGITDRPADVWEPLLALAEAAGDDWPTRARAACTALVATARSTDSGSLGVRLLADLRTVFDTTTRMGTETILQRLHAMSEAPWSDLRGRPLDPRGLASRLKPYGITSTKVKIGDASVRGYRREDLHDAWGRYLPPHPAEAEPPKPPERSCSHGHDQVPETEQVPEPLFEAKPDEPSLTCAVPPVPEVPLPADRKTGPRCPDCEPGHVPASLLTGPDGVRRCRHHHFEHQNGT